MPDTTSVVLVERIEKRIYLIRGRKVMLDSDLAELYGVQVKRLNEAVKRNAARFPEDFMLQLTEEEARNLKSQIVTSSWGGIRKLPYVFTEQGVAMLSSVLNSKRAIQMNILIMRAFVKLRSFLLTHEELALKLKELESKIQMYGVDIRDIFEAIRQLIGIPDEHRKIGGFADK